MIFEAQFTFAGHDRWNLGLPSPNYSGAFVAMLLPLVWATAQTDIVRRSRALRGVAVGVEIAGWTLLARTYSRGACVAVVGATLFWFIRCERRPFRLAFRVVSAVVGGLVTGLFARLAPTYVLHDGAVLHRVMLWRYACEMMVAAPISGWGVGQSGTVFANWFQPLSANEMYSDMVNGYLTVGTEFGLVAFWAILAGCLWIVNVGNRCAVVSRSPDSDSVTKVAMARGGQIACAVWIVWIVANVFSTLWDEPRLCILPGASLALIVARSFRLASRVLRPFVRAAAVAAVVTVGTWVVGRSLELGLQVRRVDGGVVVRKIGSYTGSLSTEVWVDEGVLGDTPGKEIRRWMMDREAPASIYVHSPADAAVHTTFRQAGGQSSYAFFGRQAAKIATHVPDIRSALSLSIIHPKGALPQSASSVYSNLKVVLPEIDESGAQAQWRSWATARGGRVFIDRGVGEDIRPVWPEAARIIELDRNSVSGNLAARL